VILNGNHQFVFEENSLYIHILENIQFLVYHKVKKMEIYGKKNVETLKVLYACYHVNVTIKTNLSERKPNDGMYWFTFCVFLNNYHDVEMKGLYYWLVF